LFVACLVVLVPAVSLVSAEFLVRAFAPQAITSDFVMPDPTVDYRLRPSTTGHMTSIEYAVTVHVNSLGFRSPEITVAKPPATKRVLFLGDSYTFGQGLNDDETLPSQVGMELDRLFPGAFQVVNAGVYGYCTANELDLFRAYGARLKPDLVVVVMPLHDVFDNKAWYVLSQRGELTKVTRTSTYVQSRRITKYIPGAGWLRAHSHLFKFVGTMVLPVLTAGGQATEGQSQGTPSWQSNPEDSRFYEDSTGHFGVTVALLETIAATAAAEGAKSVLLTLGGADLSKNTLLHQRLASAALSVGFASAINLSQTLQQYSGDEPLFFPIDRHWTAAATAFVTREVADSIVAALGTGP
jgi:hypothetical protein